MDTKRLIVASFIAVLSSGSFAAELRPAGAFVQVGVAEKDGYSVTAGVLWPWSWRREFGQAQVTGLTELFLSHWNASVNGGRHSLTQAGLLPLLRLRFDGGRSDWFFEGGIGISVMDREHRSGDKVFGSTFNFVDVLGVGRSFGADRRRELAVRISHISNGGFKKPNPGENFLQLRYAMMF